MQETQVRSLGQEVPLEEEMATPSPVVLPGKSHGQRSLADYSPGALKESNTTKPLSTHKEGFITVICILPKGGNLVPERLRMSVA